MRVKAKATVEIEIEVYDGILERGMDLNDPDFIVELIDGRNTNRAIADAFYEADDLEFELDDVPERCGYGQMEEDLRAWRQDKEEERMWLNRRYA